jgi:hypothetical protein
MREISNVGGRRRYLAIVAASLLIAVQSLTTGAVLAATATTTRILYTPTSPIAVGTPANFTAQINPIATDRTVSWYVDGTVAATDLTNPNGISQVSLTVGVGVHEIKAVLEPGVSWDGSESDPYSLTVTPTSEPIPTTLSIETSPNPAWVGETVTITFTVTPKPDGGTVTDGGLGVWPVDPTTGRAVTSLSYNSRGTYVTRAWFQGTEKYARSPETSASTLVNQHPVVAAMTVPDHAIGRGDGFDVLVDLDEAPTSGTVLIQDMMFGNPGPTLGTAIVDGSMPVVVHVPGLEPRDYLIRANFTGTDAYTAAVTTTQPITVFDRPTTTTALIEPDPSLWGGAATLEVSVRPIPDDGGFVRVSRDGSGQGFATMDWSTGTGTFDLPPTEPGAHSVVAEFIPAGWPYRYAPSSDLVGQSVSSTPIDTDPPVATMVINHDDALTTDAYVVLTMHASDASSITSVRISCDQIHWEFAGTPDGDWGWSVSDPACSSGEGLKTIFVEFGDEYGNKTVVSDSIVLENAGPIGMIILADGSTVVLYPTVTVSVVASDAGSGVSQVALSNDGTTWTTRAYAPTQTWQLSPGDGIKTVFSKWRDGYGHWSMPRSDAVKLDTLAPTGTFSIAGGAGYTKATAATLTVAATDAGSGVSQVALSNDGSTWTTRAYAASQAWTLPATNGTLTVWVKWKDSAGHWSAVKTDTIVLDTVAPIATALTWKLGPAGSALVSGAIPVSLAWTGSDATSGIARYNLSQQVDGGTWTSLSTTLTSTSLTRTLTPGHTYRYAVRAVDRAGNSGAWSYGATFGLTAVQQSSSRVVYHGTWTNSTSTTWWGGTAKGSSSAGATASLTFTGRQFAWISLRAYNRGKAQVYVNGVLVATVDLYSATLLKQRVAWSATWSTSATRTVLIKVLGTATRPRIDVDGFITGT